MSKVPTHTLESTIEKILKNITVYICVLLILIICIMYSTMRNIYTKINKQVS